MRALASASTLPSLGDAMLPIIALTLACLFGVVREDIEHIEWQLRQMEERKAKIGEKLSLLSILCSPSYSFMFMCLVVGEEGVLLGDCQNGFGKFQEDDGTVYEGQWQDGERHGKGTERV